MILESIPQIVIQIYNNGSSNWSPIAIASCTLPGVFILVHIWKLASAQGPLMGQPPTKTESRDQLKREDHSPIELATK